MGRTKVEADIIMSFSVSSFNKCTLSLHYSLSGTVDKLIEGKVNDSFSLQKN